MNVRYFDKMPPVLTDIVAGQAPILRPPIGDGLAVGARLPHCVVSVAEQRRILRRLHTDGWTANREERGQVMYARERPVCSRVRRAGSLSRRRPLP